MIMMNGRFTILEDKRAEFLQLAQAMVEHATSYEGCLAFEFLEDVFQPNSFMLFEQWADQEFMDDYLNTPTFDSNDAKLHTFFDGEPEWDEYEF
jgi:quinol monooxygenase YgiN